MEANYLKCQKCGERAVIYTAKIPTRGLKLSCYIFGLSIIGLCWFTLYNIQQYYNFTEPGVITLSIIGVIFSAICILIMILLSNPRKGRVVICEHCLAKYGITQPPRIVKDWNLDKFENLVHKGL